MTSEEYQGKYDRLKKRVYKDIITTLDDKGSVEKDNILALGYINIEGVIKDRGDYFIKTDKYNIKLSEYMHLHDLINILKYLQ